MALANLMRTGGMTNEQLANGKSAAGSMGWGWVLMGRAPSGRAMKRMGTFHRRSVEPCRPGPINGNTHALLPSISKSTLQSTVQRWLKTVSVQPATAPPGIPKLPGSLWLQALHVHLLCWKGLNMPADKGFHCGLPGSDTIGSDREESLISKPQNPDAQADQANTNRQISLLQAIPIGRYRLEALPL